MCSLDRTVARRRRQRSRNSKHGHATGQPHESPSVMTLPLVVLAAFSMLLAAIGTPFWPWFHEYMTGHLPDLRLAGHVETGVLVTMLMSSCFVAVGIGLGWWFYGRKPGACAAETDPLETLQPDLFTLLRHKFYVDELYEMTVVKANVLLARGSNWLDQFVWNGLVWAVAYLMMGLSWVNQALDEFVVNLGFDRGCDSVRSSGRLLSLWQNGRVQRYLRVIGLALAIFALCFVWGCALMNGISPFTWLTITPLVGALATALLPKRDKYLARGLGFLFSLLALAMAVVLWVKFDPNAAGMQFVEQHDWIPIIHAQYYVGIDGLGLLMVLLTTLVVPFALVATWRIEENPRLLVSFFLALQAALFGTFTALNFFHWFIFWELSLVPAFFLIKLWGGPNRVPAATQFFVYTFVGSIAMLLGFAALMPAAGHVQLH